MKNTHIKAGEEVPIELRKEVYREALVFIKKAIKTGDDFNGLGDYFLCILLPTILFGEYDFTKISGMLSENGVSENIQIMFP